ncbi:hypothetical protein [Natronogracilivirga saccharolytica]|uniref:Uncharacterized protein n=1 Tax=Natronogracilivirga saccharolytica TaxID=2812953 RepID=A0A8J7UV87_9BACT|nr:hypothetical protein [Natronogracilivirga saccharolytica]MBP3192286.1 hypothetical protein [Natronogracilivirga saccharolytica]
MLISLVPPWNRYDFNTIRALEELGFLTLSASVKKGEAKKDSKLNFLPATCDLSQLREAVISAKSSSDTQPVIVVLLHAYDFKKKKHNSYNYHEFLKLLHWLKSQNDVRLISISEAAELINDLRSKRFLLNRGKYALSTVLPSSLQNKNSITQYQEYRGTLLIPKIIESRGFYLLIAILRKLILKVQKIIGYGVKSKI